MRIIVCGGRDYDDEEVVDTVLRALDVHEHTLIQGGARGADALASRIWKHHGGLQEEYPACWEKHGRAAGPLRNQQMLDEGADLVIAFPGGRGTDDMIARAFEAGIPVLTVVSA